jgi:hypothetical protein
VFGFSPAARSCVLLTAPCWQRSNCSMSLPIASTVTAITGSSARMPTPRRSGGPARLISEQS